MLDRYLWRHNSILQYIVNSIRETCSHDEINIYADLPYQNFGNSTVPTDIVITAQKPDLVIVNKSIKKVTILELSVPFETNIEKTHQIKVDRYANLISDIQNQNFDTQYYPIEIGSRGYISNENEARLKYFFKTNAKVNFNKLKQDICKIALISSLIIVHAKYEPSWTRHPPMLHSFPSPKTTP